MLAVVFSFWLYFVNYGICISDLIKMLRFDGFYNILVTVDQKENGEKG